MTYVDHVYDIIKNDCDGIDAVYEEHIIRLVGTAGLEALLDGRYLETCGVVYGRQLYTLLKRKEKENEDRKINQEV